MGNAAIFNGSNVKILKDGLKFKSGTVISVVSVDPLSVAQPGNFGDIVLSTSTGGMYQKVTSGTNTSYNTIINDFTLGGYLNSYVLVSNIGQPNGVASLGSDGKIADSQIPAIAITDTFVVGSQSAQTALTAQVGDVAIRTDESKTYILQSLPASIFANWQPLLSPTGGVTSAFGRTGTVTAQSGDYTATQVTNTPAGNIAATTVQAALNELDSEKVAKAGDSMTGALAMGSNNITGLANPTKAQDASTRLYSDGFGFTRKNNAGDGTTLTVTATDPRNIQIQSPSTITAVQLPSLQDGVKIYIKNRTASTITVTGTAALVSIPPSMHGIYTSSSVNSGGYAGLIQPYLDSNVLALSAGSQKITDVATPTLGTDAASKNYVDTNAVNGTLSNLTGTTAVNQTLAPSANNAQDIGTSALNWNNAFITTLQQGAGNIVSYYATASLTANTFTKTSLLTYSATTYMGAIIHYAVSRSGDTNRKIGHAIISNNTTAAEMTDFNSSVGIVTSNFYVSVSGGNVSLDYVNSSGSNTNTVRLWIQLIKV
jgi:hypothetical protein